MISSSDMYEELIKEVRFTIEKNPNMRCMEMTTIGTMRRLLKQEYI